MEASRRRSEGTPALARRRKAINTGSRSNIAMFATRRTANALISCLAIIALSDPVKEIPLHPVSML